MNEIKKSDVQKPQKKRRSRKPIIFVIVSLLVIIVLSAGAYYYVKYVHGNNEASYTVVCSSTDGGKVLENTADMLAGTKQAELKQKVEQIQSLPQYDEDPNCLAIITVYYLNESDLAKAQEFMDKLSAANKSNAALDPVFVDNALSTDQIREKLKYYQELNENAKRNTIYMGEDGANAVQQ